MLRLLTRALALGLIICLFPLHSRAADSPAEALPELLRLSKELDLPMPPKGAKLVRYDDFGSVVIANGVTSATHIFAWFPDRDRWAQRRKRPCSAIRFGMKDWQPQSWSIVEPTSAAL